MNSFAARTALRVVLLAFLGCRIAAAAGADEPPRQRLCMDFGWRFQNGDPADAGQALVFPEVKDLAKVRKADIAAEAKLALSRIDAAVAHLGENLPIVQPGFDDSSWRQVDLPHDWAVELPFDPKANYQHGFKAIDPAKGTNIGWYRRTFDLPASDQGKTLWLEFDGVYRNSLVWLNGHCLGRHPSGYTSFMYDISKAARFGGSNILVVRADATRTEGWFYEGAGIYRHVWLVKTNPVHVAHWGTFVTTKVDGADAIVNVQTALENDSTKDDSCEVDSAILDADGKQVAWQHVSAVSVKAGQSTTVLPSLDLHNANLWSLESPYLYKLVTTVKENGSPVDVVETPFGIRTIRFDADQGFFLNGKHVEIYGTCNHQDHAGVGSALPDRLQSFRVEKLKEMGCNAYRTSHNPPTPELLDACDRLGMLVMDETRRMGTDPEALGQLESMMMRDRNHPCVIIWSLGNEESRDNMQADNDIGAAMCKTMQDVAHKLDPSRVCTVAMNGSWGLGFSKVIDVQGFNYVTRGGTRGGLSADAFHEKFPAKPCIGTEDASTVCTRGEYADDRAKGYVSAYDKRGTATAEKWWNFYATRPWLPGAFVWTGFDYRGEPTPYKWPCINSHFGILDTCGFPKDSFYYYKAWWTHDTVLHIFPHWNWAGKEGQDIEVWAYSNCDEVELFLNGTSLGRQKMEPRQHLSWTVKYAPGTLSAKGYRDGKEVAQDQVQTTGDPSSIALKADRTQIHADRQDVSVITVSALDAEGRAVPTAQNEITFTVSGPGKIIGVGNGDPSSHEPDKASKRRLFNGLAQVILQSNSEPGRIEVTATADGLQPATLTIQTQTSPTLAETP